MRADLFLSVADADDSVSAPKVLLIVKRITIESQAKKTQGVDAFVRLEAQEALGP